MPQIAQQDYKVIAPKPGRAFNQDAAALGELKKAILNGIGFDCLPKGITESNTLNRVLGTYEGGSKVDVWDVGNGGVASIELPYTVTQYQGLAAVQNAIDEAEGAVFGRIPEMAYSGEGYLMEGYTSLLICLDGKYLIPVADDNDNLESLTIAETGPTENFVNITWEDAQKLIGLLIS